MDKVYIAIDLKSFYASVECVDRHLDALTTNLVVADESRTEKTICLAVTPSLKAYGISGRARLFEVVQAVKEINQKRFNEAFRRKLLPKDENGKYNFSSASFDAEALAADPSLELSYIIAPPRMRLYEEISTKIFSIYMRYISPEDIHVYSIDECFIDATGYLSTYHMTAHPCRPQSAQRPLLFRVRPAEHSARRDCAFRKMHSVPHGTALTDQCSLAVRVPVSAHLPIQS